MARFRAYVTDSEEEDEDVSMEVPPPKAPKSAEPAVHAGGSSMNQDGTRVATRRWLRLNERFDLRARRRVSGLATEAATRPPARPACLTASHASLAPSTLSSCASSRNALRAAVWRE